MITVNEVGTARVASGTGVAVAVVADRARVAVVAVVSDRVGARTVNALTARGTLVAWCSCGGENMENAAQK